jgi:branched-chain amino acid transport system permease protein
MVYLPIIFVIFFGLGWIIYPLIYRAVSGKRHNPVIMGLVFTFGLSIIAKGGALSIWGYHIQSINTWLSGKSILLGVATVPALRFAGFTFGILVTILFMIFLYRTKFGIIIRATAQDRDTANLMGVDVRKTGGLVYSLYAGITGMSGVLIGALFSVHAAMGAKYSTLAFFVVVLAAWGMFSVIIDLVLGLLSPSVGVSSAAVYTWPLSFGDVRCSLIPKAFEKGVDDIRGKQESGNDDLFVSRFIPLGILIFVA